MALSALQFIDTCEWSNFAIMRATYEQAMAQAKTLVEEECRKEKEIGEQEQPQQLATATTSTTTTSSPVDATKTESDSCSEKLQLSTTKNGDQTQTPQDVEAAATVSSDAPTQISSHNVDRNEDDDADDDNNNNNNNNSNNTEAASDWLNLRAGLNFVVSTGQVCDIYLQLNFRGDDL